MTNQTIDCPFQVGQRVKVHHWIGTNEYSPYARYVRVTDVQRLDAPLNGADWRLIGKSYRQEDGAETADPGDVAIVLPNDQVELV